MNQVCQPATMALPYQPVDATSDHDCSIVSEFVSKYPLAVLTIASTYAVRVGAPGHRGGHLLLKSPMASVSEKCCSFGECSAILAAVRPSCVRRRSQTTQEEEGGPNVQRKPTSTSQPRPARLPSKIPPPLGIPLFSFPPPSPPTAHKECDSVRG